jgi:hypothetical protein
MTLDMDSITGMHLLFLAGSALVVALAAALIWPRRWRVVALVVGLLFPAYTLSSVLVGIRRNPKSHNLWPIEVGIACVLTLLPSFVGAGVGGMVGRWLARLGPSPAQAAVPRE